MPTNKELIWVREQKGWKQAQAAEKLQVSRQTLSSWEHGHSTMPAEKFSQLLTLAGILREDIPLAEEIEEATAAKEEEEPKQVGADSTELEEAKEYFVRWFARDGDPNGELYILDRVLAAYPTARGNWRPSGKLDSWQIEGVVRSARTAINNEDSAAFKEWLRRETKAPDDRLWKELYATGLPNSVDSIGNVSTRISWAKCREWLERKKLEGFTPLP